MTFRIALASAAIAALTLTACGAPSSGDAGGEGPTVVTSFYPLQWATEQVVGDSGATVEVLTKPGVDAHGMELSPRQIASLSAADLVVYLHGLQPEVDGVIPSAGAASVLDVAEVVNLAPIADGHNHDHGEEGHAEDEHADDEHSADDGHDHGDFDPHFWLDTERMSAAVEAIAAHLSDTNPAGAETYRANAEATVAELTKLDQEYRAGLAKCERREFVTTHAAFQYLAQRYDLEEIGISGINPDGEASPARIAEIHDEAQRHGVTTIFFETLTSDAVARSIAGDLGLKTAVLDPLEGVSDKSPGTDYPSIMRANLEALRSANDCQ
ncbi:MAG: metal ABC transporter substrate-binding protein [Propionibacteriaceae bacterium]|nr:metal ABC transporter substrate-binding protein [Propionibacteriaceae bacterium]